MDASVTAAEFRYDAFISYKGSRPEDFTDIALDRQIAERLVELLESYRAPKALRRSKSEVRPRVTRVFRDRVELSAAHDLTRALHEALEASRFLIVICSPRAARSPWVCEEIEFFKQRRGTDFILPLLIEGAPRRASDGDAEGAFPPPLVDRDGGLPVTPLAANITCFPPQASLSQRLQRLKGERFRLLAPLLGCAYDELLRRHHQRFVRRLLWAGSAVIILLLVIIGFTFAAVLAERQARQAIEETLHKQGVLLSAIDPIADVTRRYIYAREVADEMLDLQASTANQEAIRQETLSFAYGLEMQLAHAAEDAQREDEAFATVKEQQIPLATARLRAVAPTFWDEVADLWRATRTRAAAWLREKPPVALKFESRAATDSWRDRLAPFKQLWDIAVTADKAAEYTAQVSEFLRTDLLDLSLAEDRAEARDLLQTAQRFWQLAAAKPPGLTRPQVTLAREVDRALTRLRD